jgi:1,4-alpha-glucan branching enzyme
MPGDDWQKAANLRLLFGWQFAQTGKKLMFMGDEFGQLNEWNHETSLDWHLTGDHLHRGIQRCVADLNRLYKNEPALHQRDCKNGGFEWVDCQDYTHSVLSFIRRGENENEQVLVVFNCTPEPHSEYRIGVPLDGFWKELLNSDATEYGGSGLGNLGGVWADYLPQHNRPFSVLLTLPPLGVVFLKREAPVFSPQQLAFSN